MTKKDSAGERALELVRESRQMVSRVIEEPTHSTRFVGPLVFAVLARATSRFLAIELLLRKNLHEEAAIVLRSLANDSLRLRYLAASPETRTASALWWWNQFLGEVEKLGRAARRTHQDGDGEDLLAWVRERRHENEARQRDLGVPRLIAMPAEGRQLALAVGDPDSEIDYLLSTNPSHSALASAWSEASRADDGTTGIHVGRPDPAMTIALAGRAVHHFLHSASAMMKIIERDDSPIEALRTAAAKEFERLIS